MSEKLDKLRASLEKEKERRIKMPKVFTKKGSSPTPAQTAGF